MGTSPDTGYDGVTSITLEGTTMIDESKIAYLTHQCGRLFRPYDKVEVTSHYQEWAKKKFGLDLSGKYIVQDNMDNPSSAAIYNVADPDKSHWVHESALILVKRMILPPEMMFAS